MSKLEGLLGIGTFSLAMVSGATHGVAYAKGLPIHDSLYFLPLLGVAGFCFGAKTNHPDRKVDAQVGAVYAGLTAALYGFTFGLGYAAERITS